VIRIVLIPMCTLFSTVMVPITPVLKMGLSCGVQAARLCGARDKRHPKSNCQECLEYIQGLTGTVRKRTVSTILKQQRFERMNTFVQTLAFCRMLAVIE
jgi:hypothetical protein